MYYCVGTLIVLMHFAAIAFVNLNGYRILIVYKNDTELSDSWKDFWRRRKADLKGKRADKIVFLKRKYL